MRAKMLMLAAIVCASPVLAQDLETGEIQITLEPASPWQVSFENGVCRAGRFLESDGKKHVLTFEQIAPSSAVDFMVTGPAVENFKFGQAIEIELGAVPGPSEPFFSLGQIPNFGPSLTIMQLGLKRSPGIGEAATAAPFGRGIDIDAVADMDRLSITQGSRRVTLETGPLSDVLQIMNDCTAHILKTWGFDAGKLQNARNGPRLLNARSTARMVQEDYPLRALRNQEQGTVGLLVKVNEEGKVYECEIVSDSGSNSLNTAACDGMKRARFEPAMDEAGQPIKSYYTTRITYSLG